MKKAGGVAPRWPFSFLPPGLSPGAVRLELAQQLEDIFDVARHRDLAARPAADGVLVDYPSAGSSSRRRHVQVRTWVGRHVQGAVARLSARDRRNDDRRRNPRGARLERQANAGTGSPANGSATWCPRGAQMVPVFAVGSGLFASVRVASRRLKTAQTLAQMLGNRGGPERIRTFDLCLRRVARGAALGVIYQHLAGPCKRPVPKMVPKTRQAAHRRS
jgi:hypothetical protein